MLREIMYLLTVKGIRLRELYTPLYCVTRSCKGAFYLVAEYSKQFFCNNHFYYLFYFGVLRLKFKMIKPGLINEVNNQVTHCH